MKAPQRLYRRERREERRPRRTDRRRIDSSSAFSAASALSAVKKGLLALALAGSSLVPVASQDAAYTVITSLTMFAGTASGLWRSGDWGKTWVKTEGRAQGDSVKDVGAVRCIVPVGPRVFLGSDAGLFLSDDFGQSWTKTELAVPVRTLVRSRYPQSDPTVFAGTSGGLLRSSDDGRTFTPTLFRGAVARVEWPGPDLVLATDTGVVVSSDGGTSFRSGVGLPETSVEALTLSSFYARDPVLFAGTPKGVFRSSDGARTWSSAGLEGRAVRDLVWLGPILYAVTSEGLFLSETSGQAWRPFGEGLGDRQPNRLLFPLAPTSGAEVFLGTDRGVMRSADGGHRWQRTGALEETILALATFPAPDPVQKKRR